MLSPAMRQRMTELSVVLCIECAAAIAESRDEPWIHAGFSDEQLQETEAGTRLLAMKLLLAAPGTCVHCATEHGEYDPHNWWSIFYQMRFKMTWGRDVTHADCVAHLSKATQAAYRQALRDKAPNIEWTETEEPIREPYAMAEA